MLVALLLSTAHAGEPALLNCAPQPSGQPQAFIANCGSRMVAVLDHPAVTLEQMANQMPVGAPVRADTTVGAHPAVLIVGGNLGPNARIAGRDKTLSLSAKSPERVANCTAFFTDEAGRAAQEAFCRVALLAGLADPTVLQSPPVADVWSGTWTGDKGARLVLEPAAEPKGPEWSGTFEATSLAQDFPDRQPALAARITGSGQWRWTGDQLMLGFLSVDPTSLKDSANAGQGEPFAIFLEGGPEGGTLHSEPGKETLSKTK